MSLDINVYFDCLNELMDLWPVLKLNLYHVIIILSITAAKTCNPFCTEPLSAAVLKSGKFTPLVSFSQFGVETL